MFCLGAVMFYVLLYRSRIVPRWIALWGLAAIPIYVAAYLLAMYGAIGDNSSELNLMLLPLAVQEMVLGVWMIARGFRPAVLPRPHASTIDDALAGTVPSLAHSYERGRIDRSRDRAEDNVRRSRT